MEQSVGTEGLHSAVRHTLLCGRVMGFIPLSGLTHPSSNKLRFSLKSVYSVYYFWTVLTQFLRFSLHLYWIIRAGISPTNITDYIYDVSICASTVLLYRMSRSWPKFVKDVEEIEYNLPPMTRNLTKICNRTACLVLCALSVEHTLSQTYDYTAAKSCNEDLLVETFMITKMPWFFDLTSYSLFKAILFQIMFGQSIFMWTFNDLFVMVISIYLTEYIKLHNDLLKESLTQENFPYDKFRLHHLRIVRLVRMFNKEFGYFIVISFANNLYFICMLFYFSFRVTLTDDVNKPNCNFKNRSEYDTTHGWEHTTYFVYSFAYLVTRMFLVFLLSARVHSNSTVPLKTLYQVPPNKYNIEVERYIYQIVDLKVSISGLDFFYVSRTMILSLFATFITYELVLLQYCTPNEST